MPIDWVLGVLISSIAAVAGLWVKHILDCRDRDKARATIDAQLLSSLASVDARLHAAENESQRLSKNAHDDREYLRKVGLEVELCRQRLDGK